MPEAADTKVQDVDPQAQLGPAVADPGPEGVDTARGQPSGLGASWPCRARRWRRLLACGGAVAFAAAAATYIGYALTHGMPNWMEPVDLYVYRFGGFIGAHVRPWYNSGRAAPLYDWPGYLSLKFTYTPFAALVFIPLTALPFVVVQYLSLAVNTLATLGAIWVTLEAVGRSRDTRWARAQPDNPDRYGQRSAGWDRFSRLGGTLLIGALMFWSEPVQRTLFLGQVELVLMVLILWDLCQPDNRWWKGAGVGFAAGIKLVPLIFIPYLLLTRRFRQAAVASAAFALTVLAGFAADPADSDRWWLHGLFVQGSRTGFIGWEGNQSLRGLIARLVGSVNGSQIPWIAAAAVVIVAGLGTAMLADRAGQQVPGILICALTGILVSPISWDHHWVWVVPAVAAAIGCAVATRSGLRWAYAGLAAVITLVFFGWPGSLWGEPSDLGTFSLGLIWAPPNTNPSVYYRLGDRPWFAEYHWHGLELLSGNSYVLTGLAFLLALLAGIVISRTFHRPLRQR